MTHKDIYTKYMIEYDKANVTSSYPSLTEYEVATILDKSYLALIGQKFTGNNARRTSFEYDNKAIADIQPLIDTKGIELSESTNYEASNVVCGALPEHMMYYVNSKLKQGLDNPMDNYKERLLPVKLVTHDMAEKFFVTPYNMPWIKNPVAFIENNTIFVVYDPNNKPNLDTINISYIKEPVKFVDCLDDKDTTEFELSDQMAEELISLAIAFALENVESPRLNTKLNMRGLEA